MIYNNVYTSWVPSRGVNETELVLVIFFQIMEDWKFVAMVLDRMFFLVFTSASLIGTFSVLLQAPTIYDDRDPLTADSAIGAIC